MPESSFIECWTARGFFVFESVLKPNSNHLGRAKIPVVGVFPENHDGSRNTNYRFLLIATVNPDADRTIGVLAMNPSKALRTARKSDTTVSRLINFLRLNPRLGYGRILLGNCFAKYETDSTNVIVDSTAITKQNDICLKYLFKTCKTVVIAAGGVPIVKDRLRSILETNAGTYSLKCFRQEGWVGRHPSRGSYDAWELGEYDKSPLFT